MSAGQRNGSGAHVELQDEKVRKEDILSNRDKAQRPPGQSLDSTGVQVDEYKDIPTNQRPDEDTSDAEDAEQTDRPGFDLGGSTGNTEAGRGLGLDVDAKDDKKGWSLPREDKK